MAEQPHNAKSIFLQAVVINIASERAAFLEQACRGDGQLRAEVNQLLADHEKKLPVPEANGLPATLGQTVAEKPGTMIGPYKLLEQIGEGGMGLVYMARQQQPVKRNVALKLIKPGMDSKQVTARFAAERQALALMDHPNIARVLDAGSTETGRPYFVMDLVRGIPITDYCDRQRLSTDERLKLIVSVCQAVQHAHQKGIIHRDIKPTNVLITLHDGTPVPKVIDFGIAKATNVRLTEETLVTGFAQAVGTPSYMSPEQAALGGLDIDTRADVYSLGVLMYELLTGSTPFQDRLTDVPDAEFRRIVREEEPPKPSTRLSTLGDALDTVAEKRHTDRHTLSQQVRGELDWIVMKALEKDRMRRYETANDMSLDIGRYLSDAPVEACPPSTAYRLRKAVRRNKAAALTALAVSLALIVGTAVAIGQAIRRTRAERLAAEQVDVAREQERLAKQQERLAHEQRQIAEQIRDREESLRRSAQDHAKRAGVERQRTEANLRLALEALDSVYLTISTQRLPRKLHLDRTDQQLLTEALAFYERFAQQNRQDIRLGLDTAKAFRRVGEIQAKLGQYTQAQAAQSQAIQLLEKLVASTPGDVDYRSQLAGSLSGLGAVLRTAGSYEQAEQILSLALGIRRDLLAEQTGQPQAQTDLAEALADASELYRRMQRYADARSLAEEAVGIYAKMVASTPDTPALRYGLADCLLALGVLVGESGSLDRAESSCRRAIAELEELVTKFPHVVRYRAALARACNNLSVALARGGRNQDAAMYLEQYIQMYTDLAEQHPRVPRYREGLGLGYGNLAATLSQSGEHDEAETAGRQAIDVLDKLAGENPKVVAYQERLAAACKTLGNVLTKDPNRVEDAARLYQRQLVINAKLAEMTPAHNASSSAQSGNVDQAVGWLHAHDVDDESVAQDYRRNQAASAVQVDRFANLLKYRVQQVDSYHRLGHTLIEGGQPEQAEVYFAYALRVFQALPLDARTEAARTMHVCASSVALRLPMEPLFVDGPYHHPEYLTCLLDNERSDNAEPSLHQALVLHQYHSQPTVVHPEWGIARIVLFPRATAAHYNPRDKQLYVGRRDAGAGNGLYTIDAAGKTMKRAGLTGVVGVAVDPENGNVFFTEDLGRGVCRLEFGGTQAETWVSDFVNGNTYPVGLALVGDNYRGSHLAVGQGFVANHGHDKFAELFHFSTRHPEQEVLLHSDTGRQGLLDVPLDVTIGDGSAFFVDRVKGIFQLSDQGTLEPVLTAEPLSPTGIAADPGTANLFVVDGRGNRLVLVDPTTGTVTNIMQGLTSDYWGGAGIDVTPDGGQLIYTEHDTGAILTLTRTVDTASTFAQGRSSVEKGDLAEAVAKFTDTINGKPDHALALAERGFAYAEQKHVEKAESDWATAVRVDPKCALHYHYRGEVLREQRNLDQALVEYDKAVQLNPRLARAYLGRARVHAERSAFQLVVDQATEAIRLDPDNARAYAERGFALNAQGKADRAKRDWHEAHRIDSSIANEFFQAYQRRGDMYRRLGRHEEAVADYTSAYGHSGNEPSFRADTLCLRATALRELGRIQEALDDCDSACRLAPDSGRVALIRALMLVLAGRHAEYRQACVEMLGRFGKSDNPFHLYYVAEACTLTPRPVSDDLKPVDLARQVLSTRPERPWFLFTLGMAHFRAGQFDEAIQLFQRSLVADPTWQARYLNWLGLALVHYQRGQPSEARQWLQKAINVMEKTPDPDIHGQLEGEVLRREAERLAEDPEITP